mgnify:CR=1 FL=1
MRLFAMKTLQQLRDILPTINETWTIPSMVELYNEVGGYDQKRFSSKPVAIEKLTSLIKGTISEMKADLEIQEMEKIKAEEKVKKNASDANSGDVPKAKSKRGKPCRVSFDGNDFVGVSGTKIALWKNAKSIVLDGEFSADQLKYYGTRFTDKISYVKKES